MRFLFILTDGGAAEEAGLGTIEPSESGLTEVHVCSGEFPKLRARGGSGDQRL